MFFTTEMIFIFFLFYQCINAMESLTNYIKHKTYKLSFCVILQHLHIDKIK